MREYKLKIRNKDYSLVVREFSKNKAVIEVNGEPFEVEVGQVIDEQERLKELAAAKTRFQSTREEEPAAVVPCGGAGTVLAPIPGRIMEVLVSEGQRVKSGQLLIKMEAMKMENDVSAPVAGVVDQVKVAAGDNVNQGAELLLISLE